MKKNVVGIIIGIMSLCLFFVAVVLAAPHTVYSAVNTSSEAVKAIIESHEEAPNSLTTSIKFNGRKLFFAEHDSTWYYSIVSSDSNIYNPNIQLSDGTLNIAFVNTTTLSEDSVKKGEKINFIIYNNQYYSQYQLVATTLPLIRIDHNDELSTVKDSQMKFEIFDNRSSALRSIVQTNGKIHIRGALSSHQEKKSFRLDLRQQTPGNHNRRSTENILGMENDEDWILVASFGDSDKIRQHFNSQLWTEAASDNKDTPSLAINSRYVEVIENGEYIGLYTLSSIPSADRLKFKKNADGLYDEYLYKKTEQIAETNIDPNSLASSAPVDGYELKPQDEVSQSTAWNKLRNYLYNTYTLKDPFYIKNSTNQQNLIDTMLFATTTQNSDEIGILDMIYNMYIANIKDNGQDRYIYIPWDYDLTWGNKYDDDSIGWAFQYYYAPNYTQDASVFPTGALLKSDPYYAKEITERYKQLRQTHWSNQHINEILDAAQADIYDSGAYNRERERWTGGAYNDSHLYAFRTYVLKRFEYLDYIYGLRNDLPETIENNPLYNSLTSASYNPITFEIIPDPAAEMKQPEEKEPENIDVEPVE